MGLEGWCRCAELVFWSCDQDVAEGPESGLMHACQLHQRARPTGCRRELAQAMQGCAAEKADEFVSVVRLRGTHAVTSRIASSPMDGDGQVRPGRPDKASLYRRYPSP